MRLCFYFISQPAVFVQSFFSALIFLAQHFSQSLPLLFISIFPLVRLACRIMILLLLYILCYVTGGHSVQQTVQWPFCSIRSFAYIVYVLLPVDIRYSKLSICPFAQSLLFLTLSHIWTLVQQACQIYNLCLYFQRTIIF